MNPVFCFLSQLIYSSKGYFSLNTEQTVEIVQLFSRLQKKRVFAAGWQCKPLRVLSIWTYFLFEELIQYFVKSEESTVITDSNFLHIEIITSSGLNSCGKYSNFLGKHPVGIYPWLVLLELFSSSWFIHVYFCYTFAYLFLISFLLWICLVLIFIWEPEVFLSEVLFPT